VPAPVGPALATGHLAVTTTRVLFLTGGEIHILPLERISILELCADRVTIHAADQPRIRSYRVPNPPQLALALAIALQSA